MKTKVFLFSLMFVLLQLKVFSQLSFTLNYLSFSNSLTCVHHSVIVESQSNYTAGPINYSVSPAAGNPSPSVFVFTASATYTITGSAPGQNIYTSTIIVSQNTTAPTSSIFPQYQNLTCTNVAVASITGTALSPILNVHHDFYFSNGLKVGPISSSTAIVQPPPGTHTYLVTDALNGCQVATTFTVANGPGFPTFTITSPIQNFSIGCVPKHTVDIVFQNAQSSPAGLPVTYTILTPGSSTVWVPVPIINSYTINMPGIYTAIVRDVTTGCETRSPFSINQNTLSPVIAASVPIKTLSCLTPSVNLTGTSFNTNLSYAWYYSSTGVNPGSIYTASINSTTSNTLLGNYTLAAMDLNNACISQTMITIYQNTFKPIASITKSNPLSCTSPVILTNVSTSGIPNSVFSNTLPVTVSQWTAANQPSLALSNTYTVTLPGTYYMHIIDQNNGCTSYTASVLWWNGPIIALSLPSTYSISCIGTNTVTITSLVTNFSSCNYFWNGSSGPISNGVLTANSGTANASLQVNSPDYYTLTVQEGICLDSVIVPVYACVGLNKIDKTENKISLYPNPCTSHFQIRNENALSFPLTVEIYNSLSQKINTIEVNTTEQLIPLSGLEGIYFISVLKEGQKLDFFRLIKG